MRVVAGTRGLLTKTVDKMIATGGDSGASSRTVEGNDSGQIRARAHTHKHTNLFLFRTIHTYAHTHTHTHTHTLISLSLSLSRTNTHVHTLKIKFPPMMSCLRNMGVLW